MFQLKLADLGSAQFYANQSSGRFDEVVGTKTYMAPEIFRVKEGEVDSYDGIKADSYSAGVVIFQFFFGRPPFNVAIKEKDPGYFGLAASGKWEVFWQKLFDPRAANFYQYETLNRREVKAFFE